MRKDEMIKAIDGDTGLSVDKYIDELVEHLDSDAVGLWEIDSDGRCGFGFSGDDLVEFMSLCITALCRHGARPVMGRRGGRTHWKVLKKYSGDADEISAVIISDIVKDKAITAPEGIWMATSNVYGLLR